MVLKWTKALQDSRAHHVVQIPDLANEQICPVLALKQLLSSRNLRSDCPLFARVDGSVVIDTVFRDALRIMLTKLGLSHEGHGYQTFRCSDTTLAFDNNVLLQNLMSHGL